MRQSPNEVKNAWKHNLVWDPGPMTTQRMIT